MSSPFLIRLRGTKNGIVDLAGNEWLNSGNVTVDDTQLVNNGHAISFSGDSYLYRKALDDKFFIDANMDFTIAFWVNLDSSKSGTFASIFGVDMTTGFYPPLIFLMNESPFCGFQYTEYGYIQAPYTNNTNTYLAIVRKNNTVKLYVNGTLKQSAEYSGACDFGMNKLARIGNLGYGSSYYLWGKIDDFVFLDKAVWDSDFTPPTSYLTLSDTIYLTGQEAWGINGNGYFAKLNNNYSAMTDAEKIAMFKATDRQVPTIAQLKTLTMPIKAVSYNDDNTQPTCTVTAVPTPQTVTPKGRISLKNYAKLKGVSITGATSGNGSVKVAVTKDNSTYQVYDSTNLAWVDINIADIDTDGMSLSNIAALTTAEWLAYDCMDSGIGFAYYLEMSSTSDTAYTDELTLNVELLGELKSLVKGTDYNYSYVSNDVLQVKLYKNGDFRINYNPGES